MTTFVDSSAFFAAADADDVDHERAKQILATAHPLVTTDLVFAETWRLLRHRLGRPAAQRFWEGLRTGPISLEHVGVADLEAAWTIGQAFDDQDFSLVDMTSFAVMQRLGVTRVASFGSDFAIYRYGSRRDRAFEIVA